jgi:signal transduction histidine kinase
MERTDWLDGGFDSTESRFLMVTAITHHRFNRVELRVIDHGPGVPESDQDRIFLPFQRLGGIGSTIGVGLGLTVSRGLTEAMRGTLEPEETPGGGLTMAISVPVARGPAPAEADDMFTSVACAVAGFRLAGRRA